MITMSSTDPHERAHQRALQQDARDQYAVGEDLEVVLEETPDQNNGREGVARKDGLVVFVYPGETPVELGAHLQIRLTHVDENYVRGVAIQRVGSS